MIDLVGNRTMPDLLRERAERAPDKTWLVFEDRDGQLNETSYREFARQVQHAAAGLRSLGVGHGDRILVHLHNRPEFLITWFAAASIGAALVPSNIANTAAEIAFIVARTKAAVAITEPAAAGVLTSVRETEPALASILVTGTAEPPAGTRAFAELLVEPPPAATAAGAVPAPAPSSEDVAQILFTSGTTAQPKGVLVTHANALWSGERMCRGQGLEPTDRCLTALPLFHVNGQSVTVLSALTAGATVILLEEFRAEGYVEALHRHRATHTSVVAAQLKALLAQPPSEAEHTHALRRVGYAINVTEPEKDEFCSRFGVELINIYGSSEATETVAMSPLHGPARWPALGLPAMDRRVTVVGHDGRETEPGTVGEILVHGTPGRTIMAGYLDDPEATAEVLVDGWLHTGDIGYLDADGYLYYVDRTKNVIKTAAQNVSATEVEEVLAGHPSVTEAAVIGVPHDRRGEAVKAFVVLEAGATVSAEEIVEHCSARLARYKRPGEVEFLDALPRTSIGKLAKGELRAREAR
jgi:crotonobetaine/carnitine-CoA ligase